MHSPGLHGRVSVCVSVSFGVEEGRAFANKPSVHMGPSQHSSQNSGVGWTLGVRICEEGLME